MKNNCAEDWRGQGGGAGRASFPAPRSKACSLLCSVPCPCPDSNDKQRLPKESTQEAESCEFKDEKNQSQQSGRKECQISKFPPPQARKNPKTLSAPQVRDHLHRTLTLRELPSKLIWPFRRYTALFFSPLARG